MNLLRRHTDPSPFDDGLHLWSVWLCRLRITEQAGGHRERCRHRRGALRQLPVVLRVIPRNQMGRLDGWPVIAWTYLFVYSYSLSFMFYIVRLPRNARPLRPGRASKGGSAPTQPHQIELDIFVRYGK